MSPLEEIYLSHPSEAHAAAALSLHATDAGAAVGARGLCHPNLRAENPVAAVPGRCCRGGLRAAHSTAGGAAASARHPAASGLPGAGGPSSASGFRRAAGDGRGLWPERRRLPSVLRPSPPGNLLAGGAGGRGAGGPPALPETRGEARACTRSLGTCASTWSPRALAAPGPGPDGQQPHAPRGCWRAPAPGRRSQPQGAWSLVTEPPYQPQPKPERAAPGGPWLSTEHDGRRYHVEYDSPTSGRGTAHQSPRSWASWRRAPSMPPAPSPPGRGDCTPAGALPSRRALFPALWSKSSRPCCH